MEKDKELYERQIRIVDAQIDELVNELYGLTEEEIKVVEGSIQRMINKKKLDEAIDDRRGRSSTEGHVARLSADMPRCMPEH